MKSLTFRIMLVLLAVASIAIYFAATRPANATDAPHVQSSAPAQPKLQAAPSNSIRAIGNFLSGNQAMLGFQVYGRTKTISVKEGARVKAGDLLIALDTTILDAQIAQAQTALDAANVNLDHVKQGPTSEDIAIAKSKLDLARAQVNQAQAAYDRIGGNLNPASAITAQALTLEQATATFQGALAVYNQTVNHPTAIELRTAQVQVAQAQAALDFAKQNLTTTRMVAPFDGVVIWVGLHLGEAVTPSVPVITVSDLSKMQVQVGVDENTLSAIQIGQSATIATDSLPGTTLTGRVSKIGLVGTTTAGIVTVPVTIDVDPSDAAVYPGYSATVDIQLNK